MTSGRRADPRNTPFGRDQQLTPWVRPVGAEIAQVGDVDELVVDHGRPADVAVDEDRAGLGRAYLRSRCRSRSLRPTPSIRRHRRRRGPRHEVTTTEHVVAHVDKDVIFDRSVLLPLGEQMTDPS